MPNITIYLENEVYAKFITSDKQKEIREKCIDKIKENVEE